MQEIKKRRIVLASLLKPVDDTRMFGKLGATLASTYDVYIVGQPTKGKLRGDTIRVISLPATDRLSLQRMLAPWRVLRNVLRIRPDLLIVCTAELLTIALCARLLCGAKVVYDIQENYAMNLLHGNAWPRVMRRLLASAARMAEWTTSPIVSHYLLAERSYARELRFIGRKFTVIENKVVDSGALPDRPAAPFAADSPNVRLLFSGTLAETTGVFVAIDLARQLFTENGNITLTVIGYAAKAEIRTRLKQLATEHTFLHLQGIDDLVPHTEILQAIHRSDFGIISYPRNPSTWSAYPTKLYEYMGHRLPLLLIRNPEWVRYCASYNAAVVFDPADISADALLREMEKGSFYTRAPDDVFWESEAPKLLQAIDRILPEQSRRIPQA